MHITSYHNYSGILHGWYLGWFLFDRSVSRPKASFCPQQCLSTGLELHVPVKVTEMPITHGWHPTEMRVVLEGSV